MASSVSCGGSERTELVVTPREKVRQHIVERNRYNPVSPAKAHRATVPGKGVVQQTEKQDGDIVLNGVSKDEQPS
ncbi:MAG: hypothetical protein EHM18_10540 [Acidobacteria bacterium]|nr:MAG: hypothetical protein EHM18_10540 [Acidobacteriota bacterium]